MGIEDGTCWDEPWVLYGNQFDNKFHIKKKRKTLQEQLQYHLSFNLVGFELLPFSLLSHKTCMNVKDAFISNDCSC